MFNTIVVITGLLAPVVIALALSDVYFGWNITEKIKKVFSKKN